MLGVEVYKGRPILYSLCGWSSWYAPEGRRLANSWRISADCDEWANIYVAVRAAAAPKPLRNFTRTAAYSRC